MKNIKKFLIKHFNLLELTGIVLQTIISCLLVALLFRYANNYLEYNLGEWFITIIEGSNDINVYNSLFGLIFLMSLYINAFILYFVSNILLIIGKINKSHICSLLGILMSLFSLILIVCSWQLLIFKILLMLILLINLLAYIGNRLNK